MRLLSYFFPQHIATSFSNINGEIKVVEHFGKYAVYVDGVPQSGAEIRPMWEKIIKTINNKQLTINNCLVLGIGGGNVIIALNKYFPKTTIAAVELDPVMAEIACKYFGLNNIKLLKIIIGNALSFVAKNNLKEKYDLIVVDLFIGKLNPPDSRSAIFLHRLKNRLTKTGIILFNSHYIPDKPDEFERLTKFCKKIFQNLRIIFSYRFNRVLLLR